MEDVTASVTGSPPAMKPSLEVVERVAELEDTDPAALTPPLYTAVDPDALDSLCHRPTVGTQRSAGRVSFTYCGYEVTVSGDGDVSVSEPR
ncbi:HalOD1 output domain-containing protein [Natrinema sp. 74]|uniref:HalOD1 output domain-containing protein n=1 Tax=Natrinema sp. 74 TaxID=3384159 RepID=UPI0038D413DA